MRFQLALTNVAAVATPNAATLVVPGVTTIVVTKRGIEHEETGVPEPVDWYNQTKFGKPWRGVNVVTMQEAFQPEATPPPKFRDTMVSSGI